MQKTTEVALDKQWKAEKEGQGATPKATI